MIYLFEGGGMVDNTWLVILSISLFIIVTGVLAAVGILIYAIVEIKRLSSTVNEFLKRAEEKLNPLIYEAEQSLRSCRKISDDFGAVTENVHSLSDAAYEITANIKALSGIVNDFREGISLRTSGIKAGVKTAFNVLISQLKERRQ